ncbi:hypothetical protein bAD24_p01205 (plasmid) [Burkholderia sp. AD24]|nr:hypothetical protein bAD24_p01205 [Burkholderia sp. AD24]
MKRSAKAALPIAAFLAVVSVAACKKADHTSRDALNFGSSGVMSNSAGLSGTPGTGAAAKRASDPAPASAAPAAVRTPDATASGASSVQGGSTRA